MQITVNGKNREINDGATVTELIKELSLNGPLAVEINRDICPKSRHPETHLKQGDVLEIVTIVGGG